MEELVEGRAPFDEQWNSFQEQFKARFKMVDEAVNTKVKLCVQWQDTSTVSEYAALFKELMACTEYSRANLRDCFYKHLLT
jgi:hypothetical protein